MSQYTELRAQIALLQEQAEAARKTEVETVLTDIRRKIVDYGLTAHDLGLSAVRRGRPPKKEPLPPMYKDPVSGSTWSGRGKPPRWIMNQDRAGFVIRPEHA